MKKKFLLPILLIPFLLTGCGTQGPVGPQGSQGEPGTPGEKGDKGDKGVSITKVEKTSSEGNIDTYTITFSDGTSSTFNITNGQDGSSPTITIGTNGNWYIDNVDTGKSAQGPQGKQGDPGDDGRSIVTVIKTSSEGNVDTYTITFSDKTTSTFTVTNGKDGKDGTSVLTGKGEPSSTLGKDGDSYINLDTWDYFLKENGAWNKKGNIKGEKGDLGETGPHGEKGDTGISITKTEIDENGDLIVTFSNGDVVNAGHIKDANKYTVNFYCDDVLVNTQIVEPNSKLEEPAPIKKTGYEFDYWYAEDYVNKPWVFSGYYADRVIDDVNLYAKYSPLTYVYVLDPGEGGSVDPTSLKISYGNPYELPVPTTTQTVLEKELIFDSWYIGNNKLPLKGDSWSYLDDEETLEARYIRADDYYSFTKNEETNSYILSKCKQQLLEMVVPKTYNGLPVTTIGDEAFRRCKDIKSIVIQDNITKIGARAFADCESLKCVYIPDSVSVMGAYAFNGSETILLYCEAESLPKGWATYWYGSSEHRYWGVTDYGTYNEFKYVIQNDGVTIVGCDSTESSLYIPDEIRGLKVKTIGRRAFESLSTLTSIRIPDSVTKIDYRAFARCENIVSLNIPKNLEILGDSSLFECKSLVSIELPSTLHTIEMYALSGCLVLSSLIIPKSVKTMGQCVFSRDDEIDTIYCEASSKPSGWHEEWNEYCDADVVWGYRPNNY